MTKPAALALMLIVLAPITGVITVAYAVSVLAAIGVMWLALQVWK